MRTLTLLTTVLSFVLMGFVSNEEGKSIYTENFEIKTLTGEETIKLSDFQGKKVLIVNVASKCGYTPQYEGLQKLYDANKDKLVIIGFPCNQFGGQEPGSGEEIQSFCKKNFGVTFPMTEKIDVKGDNQHPIYQWLTQKTKNGVMDAKVRWNFNKFLLNEKGELVKHYSSGDKPESIEI